MVLRVVAALLLLLAPLQLLEGLGSGPVSAQAYKDDDFAEFEDEDMEFDFEVSDSVDEDCEL